MKIGSDVSLVALVAFILFYEYGVTAHNNCVKTCELRLRIDAGWLCGRIRTAEDGTPYASFRGVPYAKPPLAERRFKELEAPEPWEHLLDATEERATCPQKDFIYSRMPLQLRGQSEDCIYLNLHLPLSALGRTKQLPILVMVHGGGFQAGAGQTDMHGPEYLMRNDVIVITFEFRINIFGFLSLNTAKIPGNQCLRDIITLLRWVQRNALNFGGDPKNVTLVGHSTGATSAHLVSLSKAVKGLINRVILMSGTAIPNYFDTSPEKAKSTLVKLLAILGINSTDPDYIHDRLTKEPIINIMNAVNVVQLKSDVTELIFIPVVESEFPNVTTILDDNPLQLMAKGRGKEFPMIIGFTTAEFNYFKWQLLAAEVEKRVKVDASSLLPSRLRRNLSPKEVQRLTQELANQYFKVSPTIDTLLNVYSDVFFRHPALLVAEWRSLWGAPVYLYRFSYESERNVVKEANWCAYEGVAHVEDLTFLFRINSILQDYVSYPAKNNDDLMKEWLPKLITNFVRCGNPTCTKDELQWPPLSPGRLEYQDIAMPMVYRMSNLTREERGVMQFFEQFDVEFRNVGEQIRKNSALNKTLKTLS